MNYDNKVKYHKALLEGLQESYKGKRLIPFIGAGFSKNVDGYPDWDQFNEKLSTLLGKNKYYLKEKFEGFDVPAIGSDYYSIRKFRNHYKRKNIRSHVDVLRNFIQSAIKKMLDYDITDKKSKVHKYLVEKFSYIFTTNWDKLLEENCDKSTLEVISDVTHISDIHSHVKDEKKLIIKMHGTLDDPKNIVASLTDYFDLVNNKNQPFNLKYQNELLHYDFLFIGFSFKDPNISNLTYPIHLIKKKAFEPGHEPKIFMLDFSEYDQILAELYKELMGIDVFFLDIAKNDKTKATLNFLKSIVTGKASIPTESLFKKNLITELKDKKGRLSKEIEFLNIGINNRNFKDLHDKFKKEKEELEFKLKKIEEKIESLEGGK
ncbi:MAG: hypothetical protein CV087_17695 [Candidatus Brocadia sp. WS118]|nr:MAG: hypothetical protein CV087_17695 [Candidatus Brocadia sp. WS118]